MRDADPFGDHFPITSNRVVEGQEKLLGPPLGVDGQRWPILLLSLSDPMERGDSSPDLLHLSIGSGEGPVRSP